MMTAASLARALGKAKREGAGWYCLCPVHEAHGDHEPSLSITEKGEKLLFICRAGCSQEAVIDELKRRGLWLSERDKQPRTETVYDYCDEFGDLRYQVVRRPVNGSRKKFVQRRPDGAGDWVWNVQGVVPLPYRLPGLLAAEDAVVFIAEGEKDCDNLAAGRFVATCNSGGAEKWQAEISPWLKGRDVVILPDNDETGRRRAADVARQLTGIASRIRFLELPGLPEKGDVSKWIELGGTREQFLELARNASPSLKDAPRRQFPLVRFDDIELTSAARCIVEDLIPKESLVLVWGPPKCGKSFFVFDLLMHVALEREYRGKRVEQGTVVYIAAEGELGIRQRVAAFRQARMQGDDRPQFYLLTTRLDLAGEIDALISDLKAQLGDEVPAIVAIDTLNRTIAGSESKDEDMGAYRDAADRIRVEFGCTVVIIHHCGIDGSRPRGHTSLTGAIDAQLAVKRDDDKTILVTLEYMKDGPEGDMMRLGLKVVDVGFDDHGKEISSCVIEHLDAPVSVGRQAKPKKLPTAQALALKLLHAAIIAGGEVPPHYKDIPTNTACVHEDLWRRYCYQGGISGGETQEAKRAAFTRAAEALLDAGRIGSWDGWVWPVPSTAAP